MLDDSLRPIVMTDTAARGGPYQQRIAIAGELALSVRPMVLGVRDKPVADLPPRIRDFRRLFARIVTLDETLGRRLDAP